MIIEFIIAVSEEIQFVVMRMLFIHLMTNGPGGACLMLSSCSFIYFFLKADASVKDTKKGFCALNLSSMSDNASHTNPASVLDQLSYNKVLYEK